MCDGMPEVMYKHLHSTCHNDVFCSKSLPARRLQQTGRLYRHMTRLGPSLKLAGGVFLLLLWLSLSFLTDSVWFTSELGSGMASWGVLAAGACIILLFVWERQRVA